MYNHLVKKLIIIYDPNYHFSLPDGKIIEHCQAIIDTYHDCMLKGSLNFITTVSSELCISVIRMLACRGEISHDILVFIDEDGNECILNEDMRFMNKFCPKNSIFDLSLEEIISFTREHSK